MKIALANASTLVDNVDALAMAAAEKHALDLFAADWDRQPPAVGFTTDPDDAGLGELDCLIVILDDADQAGALGYHDVTPTGQPYARVFARDSIAGLTGADPASLTGVQPREVVLATVMSVIDHEAKEAFVDPEAAGWEDDGTGTRLWAREVCDPVESTVAQVDVPLEDGSTVAATLSAHVLPAFFDAHDKDGPWDSAGVLTGPFTLAAGGYAIVETEDPNAVQAVWGDVAKPAGPTTVELYGEQLPGWKRDAHAARQVGSRTAKRLAHLTETTPDAETAPANTTAPADPAAEIPGSVTAGEPPNAGPADHVKVIDADGKIVYEGPGPIPHELITVSAEDAAAGRLYTFDVTPAEAAPSRQSAVAIGPEKAPVEEGGHPEPRPGIGPGTALTVQDNVTEPGVQKTATVTPDGDPVESSHGEPAEAVEVGEPTETEEPTE